jgi:ABC-type transport system involved in cytochrome c biogenesis permease subunit
VERTQAAGFVGFMPLVWLRVAVAFYSVGLVYSLLLLSKQGNVLGKIVEPAVGLGLIFHFVSLVESTVLIGHLSWASIHYSESILAFMAMVVFFIFFVAYRTVSPGVVIFPIVFVLTFASAVGQKPITLTSPLLRSGWIFVHVVLIFTGYAGLFLSFGASLLYLVQERALKSKRSNSPLSWLPPLQTIDEICYRSLLFGFPFMTLGLVAGSVLAIDKYGPLFFYDPKILLSFIMWCTCCCCTPVGVRDGAGGGRRFWRPSLLSSPWASGRQTVSAAPTGLSSHELHRHRREPPDCTG